MCIIDKGLKISTRISVSYFSDGLPVDGGSDGDFTTNGL